MSWAELMELLDWCTPRWTEIGRWSEERIYAFHEDLADWDAADVREAVRHLYEDGAKAPTGGAVVKTLRAFGHSPTRDLGGHRHRWAILEYEDDREDGRRLGYCVVGTAESRCRESRTFDPGELRTVSELDEAKR